MVQTPCRNPVVETRISNAAFVLNQWVNATALFTAQIIRCLKIDPECWRGLQVAGKFDRQIGVNPDLASHELHDKSS